MITTGQSNIWRMQVRLATREALYQRRPFTTIPDRYSMFCNEVKTQVARATFCAKLDGYEYSRYKP